MSDELTIQPGLNPQIQPQKTSSTPYVLGGAVAGGAVGGAINHYMKKPMCWEDVIKEAKDTTDFSSKAEPASWEGVKAKAKEVADLEEKLKAVPEKTLAEDAAESIAKRDAIAARDKEFERLLDVEKKKASGRTVSSMPTAEDMRLGIKGDDASKVAKDYKLYNDILKPDYDAKVKAVKTGSAPGHAEYIAAENGKNNFETKIKKYYEETAQNALEKNKAVRKNTEARLEKELNILVNNEYKHRTDKEILEKAFKDGQMVEKKGWRAGLTSKTYTDPKTGKIYVLKDDVKFSDLKKTARDEVNNLRTSLLDNIKSAESNYNEAASNMKDFTGKNEFRRLSKKGNPNTAYVCDLADINGKNAVKDLEKEAKIIERLADPKKSKKVTPAEISALQSKYGANPKEIAGNKKIAEQVQKRLTLAKEYADINKSVMDSLGGQDRITAYKEKMQNAIDSNKDVKSAAKKIKALAKRYGINVETSANIDEAALKDKVTQAMKDGSFEKKVAEATKKYEEAVASKGVVNSAAREAIEKELTTAKDNLKTAAEDLGAKYKKGGTNKWVAAGIGAAIGAAALWSVASSKNKSV